MRNLAVWDCSWKLTTPITRVSPIPHGLDTMNVQLAVMDHMTIGKHSNITGKVSKFTFEEKV